ncbi:hypothetical protein [Polaromonas glacialis]|uniref:hypothetical protein n=1 Tax=Polaromonas glacialis TaxID=866564 RepID=UPI000494E28F|nr:hypothetical protein [Polaromonas glacialis]
MNIIKRTCATCCAFNPAPHGDDPACLNLTFITEHHGTQQAVGRDPGPADWCPSHMTHKEDRAEDVAIAGFWQRLGIEPKRGRLPD